MYMDVELELRGSFNQRLWVFLIACSVAISNNYTIVEPYFNWEPLYKFSDIFDVNWFNESMENLIVTRDLFNRKNITNNLKFRLTKPLKEYYNLINIHTLRTTYTFILRSLKALSFIPQITEDNSLYLNQYNIFILNTKLQFINKFLVDVYKTSNIKLLGSGETFESQLREFIQATRCNYYISINNNNTDMIQYIRYVKGNVNDVLYIDNNLLISNYVSPII